jgi:hypothetical protein
VLTLEPALVVPDDDDFESLLQAASTLDTARTAPNTPARRRTFEPP